MRILKEPLVHFFLIGAAIFGWFHVISPQEEAAQDPETITISESDVDLLVGRFETTWKRPPNEAELQTLVDASIREEVLVREARKLGLDRGDTVIRNRLSQKVGFLIESMATSVVPDDGELETFFQQNANRYATAAKIAFNQVFLGEAPGDAEVEDALASLRAGQKPSTVSGASMLPRSMPLSAQATIDNTFGTGFSSNLAGIALGDWAGPVRSGYGEHLVQVLAIEPSQLPPLEEIYHVVLSDWRRTLGEDLTEAQYQVLASTYEIVTPDQFSRAQ